MYKVIVIDDEPLARSLVIKLLQSYPDFQVVDECPDGFEAFKSITKHNPDLLFLDIQMPRINGFELLEMLDKPPAVIFTTAFDEYALKAFESHAVDYLLKPVTRERFDKAIQKCLHQALSTNVQAVENLLENQVYEGYQHRIVVKDRGNIRIIPAEEIHYIEANDDYIKIVTKEGSFLKKNTLTNVEKTLDPNQFVRVHRSYLMPISQLQSIEPYEKNSHIALLHCGMKISVSQSGMARLKSLLGL
ncbi:MAG: response regulator [Chitinophagaceae bacterium]|jgi:two-component system LytT family response regulator